MNYDFVIPNLLVIVIKIQIHKSVGNCLINNNDILN